jgi:hypothetical protein
MTTTSTPYLDSVARIWEIQCGYASAVFSGIVPDQAHLDRGGPHVSIEDLRRFGNYPDYSTPAPLGRPPAVKNLQAGSAIDMSMNRTDMIKLYWRVLAVWARRTTDPRARYINAWNVWDGNSSHPPRRLNFQTGANTEATWDHTWHSHGDLVRALWDELYAGSHGVLEAVRAVVSMLKGESVEQFLGIGDKPIRRDAMHILARDMETRQLYFCDYVESRPVADARVSDFLWLSGKGAIDLWTERDGKGTVTKSVWEGWSAEVFGPVRPTLAADVTVEVDEQLLDRIAERTADVIAERGQA